MKKPLTTLSLTLLICCSLLTFKSKAQNIYTIAGGGFIDNVQATTAELYGPSAVAIDAAGNIYIADGGNHRIRLVNTAGVISTFAGTGITGYTGNGGQASAAELNNPVGVSFDALGNLYIADAGNQTIRKITTAGIITTVAGLGGYGFSGDGGQATSATLHSPNQVGFDGLGNMYICDSGNNRVRKINTAGVISTIAGTGTNGFSGDGGQSTAAQLNGIASIAVDASNNIYLVDNSNNRVRKINTAGIINTIAGTGTNSFTGDGGQATAATFNQPNGIGIDAVGNLYITDGSNSRIRSINTSGIIKTVAGVGTMGFSGDGGQATAAQFYFPSGSATIDPSGNIYIIDGSNNRIRKVNTAGIINTFAGNGVAAYSGDGAQATVAQLNNPYGVSVDALGNLFISDENNNRIRKVTTSGVISTFAGNGTRGFTGDGGQATSAEVGLPYGLNNDAAGNVYIADFGNTRIRKVSTAGVISTVTGTGTGGFSGDGGQATAAKLNTIMDLTTDAAGNIYVVDANNYRIRKINTAGIINTIAGNGTYGFSGDGGQATAAELSQPSGVAVDAAGNVYIADFQNLRVRKINTLGIISTVAGSGSSGYTGNGGQATLANLDYPGKVAVDAVGNIYISEQIFVRKISTTGIITAIAGTGNANFTGDGGLATAASFNTIQDIVLDAAGNLYISDGGNNRIRVISAPLNITANAPIICKGGATVLTANGAASYTWAPATGLSATTGSTVAANPTVTTTYTISGVSTQTVNGVAIISTGITLTTVSVSIPNIVVNTATICAGATTTLTASGANTYTWSTTATGASITPSPTITANYTVTGTDINNCTNKNTTTVTVNPLPNVTVNSGAICKGQSFTLTPNGANTYTYSSGGVIVSPTTTATYSITGTSVAGCLSSNTAVSSVTVNTLPTINVNTSTICIGATTTLTASGANTYTWNTSNIGASITPSPTITTNYTVNATDINNCKNSSTSTITVNNLPIIGVNSATVCAGITTTLTANGAATYTWNTNAIGASITPAPTTITHYTVTGTDINNCTNIDTTTIYVNALPTIIVNNASICVGTTTTLTANGAITYTWNTTDNGSAIVVSPITPTNYTVTGTDINNCINTTTTSVIVHALPNAVAISNTPCETQQALNFNCGVSPTGTYTYTWSGPNSYTASIKNPSIATANVNVALAGTYTVWVTDINNCVDTATVDVIINPLPIVTASGTTVCIGQTINITSSGALNYAWSGPNAYISNIQNPSIANSDATMSGAYVVIGTDGNGCYNTANAQVMVSGCTDVNKLTNLNEQVSIYPNPTGGNFVLELLNSASNVFCTIYDVNGKLVLSQTIYGKTTVDATNLANGIYTINMISSEGVVNKKLIITH